MKQHETTPVPKVHSAKHTLLWPDFNNFILVMRRGAHSTHDADHCEFFFPFFLMQMESYFPNWFMNSEEAKALHVGAEWMSVLRSRIMGPKAVKCCWSDTCIVGVTSPQVLVRFPARDCRRTQIAWWRLHPEGLPDPEPLHRNRSRTQEGVSGWAVEIIAAELFNMHHEDLWAHSQIHSSCYKKASFIWIPQKGHCMFLQPEWSLGRNSSCFKSILKIAYFPSFSHAFKCAVKLKITLLFCLLFKLKGFTLFIFICCYLCSWKENGRKCFFEVVSVVCTEVSNYLLNSQIS